MRYIRTKDGITTSNKATHELIEDICDAGYLKTLKKGACIRIDKEWFNFYGRWVDLIDENGCHYSIRPSEVEKVTKELPQADTIEELCDELMIRGEYSSYIIDVNKLDKDCDGWTKEVGIPKGIVKVYGAIWVIDDNGAPTLKSVAKANEKGELELL